jgi:Metallo-beta-lactamase superfamily
MKEPESAVCGKKQGDIMKKQLLKRPLTALVFAIALAFAGSTTYSQESEQYVPLLPKVRERMLPVDYSKGYLVKEMKPDVYIITDGSYQSMFVTTGQGVILFDAPPSFAQHIKQAVAEVTKEPIQKLIYSHAHVDHIAGAEFLKDIPNLEIISEKGGAVLFYTTDYPEAGRAVARLITASGFSPVRVGGLDQSIRIEVGGDLHEFGKLGKLVSAKEAEALV